MHTCSYPHRVEEAIPTQEVDHEVPGITSVVGVEPNTALLGTEYSFKHAYSSSTTLFFMPSTSSTIHKYKNNGFSTAINEQPIQVKKTSPKATDENLSKTSVCEQATDSINGGKNCFLSQVEEEEKEIKEKIVHQDLKCEDEEFKPGKSVKYRNRLWVVKEIKVNGVIEIQAPYSRSVKKVDQKLLNISWCDESKRNTNIKASN
ncbi:hypothetical protein LR48_Vigan04g097900 [Vigna angularis]|uniref:Uncharacterized protein n=1 Tax=Phaseolus angularis TaxID=3914 RepID=A0A0L9UDI1_PHAAN|nr:hypothetical protein LR48_Vigan04g097900 [Vigna angularis]